MPKRLKRTLRPGKRARAVKKVRSINERINAAIKVNRTRKA